METCSFTYTVCCISTRARAQILMLEVLTYVSENYDDVVPQQGQLEFATVIVIGYGLKSLSNNVLGLPFFRIKSIRHYYFNKKVTVQTKLPF